MTPNRLTPKHIIIKMKKVKERILKTAREKQRVSYKGTPIKLSADFSTETLQARREWHNIFKVLKGKNLQPRILYPATLSFRIEGEINNFSVKLTKRIQQFRTYPKRNIERSLNRKEARLHRKGKNHNRKGNYIKGLKIA